MGGWVPYDSGRWVWDVLGLGWVHLSDPNWSVNIFLERQRKTKKDKAQRIWVQIHCFFLIKLVYFPDEAFAAKFESRTSGMNIKRGRGRVRAKDMMNSFSTLIFTGNSHGQLLTNWQIRKCHVSWFLYKRFLDW